MARPTRRRPTSTPRTRIGQCYNFEVTVTFVRFQTPRGWSAARAPHRAYTSSSRARRAWSVPLAVCWLAGSIVLAAGQDERARTEELVARAGARLEALHREADQLASQERTLL